MYTRNLYHHGPTLWVRWGSITSKGLLDDDEADDDDCAACGGGKKGERLFAVVAEVDKMMACYWGERDGFSSFAW